MGSFQAGADAIAVMDAGNAVGIYDERTAQALTAVPGAVWDTGSAPADADDLKAATRSGFNAVGLYDELADKMVAKVSGGLKAVVTVPDVVGSLLPAASAALVAAGLRVGTITTVTSAEPVGEVTAQSVAAGASEVFKPIDLSVSDGEG